MQRKIKIFHVSTFRIISFNKNMKLVFDSIIVMGYFLTVMVYQFGKKMATFNMLSEDSHVIVNPVYDILEENIEGTDNRAPGMFF